jgi:hypothetical protein
MSDPTLLTVRLPSGTLSLRVEDAELPLDALCGFGSRRSRKRGFLFISKVLGKHIPVRPSVMEDVHVRLASQLVGAGRRLPGPVVVLALAETATALGQGVFEQLLRLTPRDDVLFLHTTRYHLSRPPALRFDESHSHAPDHLLYQPLAEADRGLFREARSLVLIDDEISTGRTLVNLANAYRRLNPSLERVTFVCITDWLGESRRQAIRDELDNVEFVSLLRGGYRFEDNPRFQPGPIPDVTGRGDLKDAVLPRGGGRAGLRTPLSLDLAALTERCGVQPGERVLVLGTGEFAYPPFLLARHLESRGLDVRYQSTTRSPILPGGAVSAVLEFTDNYHDEIPNFVYNVSAHEYDRVVIGYETHPLPDSHRLAEMLSADVLRFGD